ncbi:MAG: hypothetical protein JRI77_13700 [Deltaproteobacteria bacterium]|nr:hypothetical protein [Deltaproteobacteria bacterium]
MRLLILFGILYICYRYLKSWMASHGRTKPMQQGKAVKRVDDVMVRDPFCGAYFPKNNGVHLKLKNQNLLFCSRECRDKYLASRSGQTS